MSALRIQTAAQGSFAGYALADSRPPPPAPRRYVLVVPGRLHEALHLLHAGRRLATSMNADWSVVQVQTSTFRLFPDRERERSAQLSSAADSLGGGAVQLHGHCAEQAIVAYARLRGAMTILVGVSTRWSPSLIGHQRRIATLRRLAPEIEILGVVPDAPDTALTPPSVRRPTRQMPSRWSLYLWGLAITAVCTGAAFPLAGHIDLINIVMLYMLGMAAAGLWLGRGPSTLVAVANIFAFDLFFVPPLFSLEVLDARYLVTFAVMLLVALIIANLMIAVREQTEAAALREQHSSALYAVTRELAGLRDVRAMAESAVRCIGEQLQCRAAIILCDSNGRLPGDPAAASRGGAPTIDPAAAQWAVVNRQRAGAGACAFTSDPVMYLPLLNLHSAIGVLAAERLHAVAVLPAEQAQLLEALAGQLASALERTRMTEMAHKANLAAERAATRNTMLASISHDLRIPLSAIAGAGSIVAQRDFSLDIHRRVTLGRLIEDKARNMSDLLSNILQLIRLESGFEALNGDWYALGELVGIAIQQHEARLAGWHVVTAIPDDLPMLWLDATLMLQLLSNLLENAVKYTPPHTRISIQAAARTSSVLLAFEDDGPGWATDHPERLLEKFSRASGAADSVGMGLGLAICKAVVRLHGGEIRALRSDAGGARIETELPLREPQLLSASAELQRAASRPRMAGSVS